MSQEKDKAVFERGERPLLDKEVLRWYVRYYSHHKLRIVIFTIGASILSLLSIPVLALIRYAFDEILPLAEVGPLIWIGVAITGIRFFASGLTMGLRSLGLRITLPAVRELRTDLITSLYHRSRTDLNAADPAMIQVKIVQDSERVDRFSNTLLYAMLPAAAASVVLGGYLLYLNWVLLVLALVLVPAFWYINHIFGFIVKKEVFRFQRSFEKFSNGVLFVLRQMDLTRIRGYEPGEIEKQKEQLEIVRWTGHKTGMAFALHNELQRTLSGVGGILVLVVGGAAVARGTMTVGSFITFYVAAGMLRTQVERLIDSIPTLIAGNESLFTLKTLLESGSPEPYSGSTEVDILDGIRLDGVDFHYGREQILSGLDLSIPGHSNLAIVGPNGSGKSTILHLILGFYRPGEGTLWVGDTPYDQIDIRKLRRSIGVVPQHPKFFMGNILENITYGFPEATQDDVDKVVDMALAREVLDRLPEGYDTEIGDAGVLLSGGEAQRLAIARALLGRPRLLILDEPTNHLDADSIIRLMKGLTTLDERPGLLFVSHDPGVVSFAGEIQQLKDGALELRPAEVGS